MKAIVIGATGLVGENLTQKLLADSSFEKVICLTRKEFVLDHEKYENIVFDSLDGLEKLSGDLSADCYFCCLGTTLKKAGSQKAFEQVDIQGIKNFALLAKKNKSPRFVLVSASGASASSPFFYSRVKAQTEQAVAELGFDQLIIFRPALLVGHRNEARALEEFGLKMFQCLKTVAPAFLTNRLGTSAEVLAAKMIAKAKVTSENLNKIDIIEASEIAE